MNIKIWGNAYLPEYQTDGASGADLKARGEFQIFPFSTGKIPLGVAFEIPRGYEVQIRPRSGLSLKGIQCQLGTVDSDYRGEVRAMLHNSTNLPFTIKDGDRVAQMVYTPVMQVEFCPVEALGDTPRGSNGFGSTGV